MPSCWRPSARPGSACRQALNCLVPRQAAQSCSGTGHAQAAENLIKKVNIYDPSLALYRDALSVVRGASLNCYNFDLMEVSEQLCC